MVLTIFFFSFLCFSSSFLTNFAHVVRSPTYPWYILHEVILKYTSSHTSMYQGIAHAACEHEFVRFFDRTSDVPSRHCYK